MDSIRAEMRARTESYLERHPLPDGHQISRKIYSNGQIVIYVEIESTGEIYLIEV